MMRKVGCALLSRPTVLNDLPSGKQMVNIGPKGKGVDKLCAVTPRNYWLLVVELRGFEPLTP